MEARVYRSVRDPASESHASATLGRCDDGMNARSLLTALLDFWGPWRSVAEEVEKPDRLTSDRDADLAPGRSHRKEPLERQRRLPQAGDDFPACLARRGAAVRVPVRCRSGRGLGADLGCESRQSRSCLAMRTAARTQLRSGRRTPTRRPPDCSATPSAPALACPPPCSCQAPRQRRPQSARVPAVRAEGRAILLSLRGLEARA